MPRALPTALALLALALPVRAQEPPDSPYAGEEGREIAALSGEEVAALLEGEGMGLALVAELNHHPGPRHALDLADSLELTDGQRARIEAIHGRMKTRARALGSEIVAAEARLDRAFAEGTVEPASLEAAVAEIARLGGELRAVHLLAHLETRAELSAHQVARYDRLRGYAAGEGHADHAH